MDSAAPEIFDLESHPEKTQAVLALLETNFPKGAMLSRPLAFQDEFFALLDPQNRSRILFTCDENGDPISALGFKMFRVHEPVTATKISVAGIGLVVTDQASRGRGLSSALLEAAEARAVKEGALLCCLWSGLEFYMKRDYLPLGSELAWVLDEKERNLLERRLRTEAADAAIVLQAGSEADVVWALELFAELKIGPARDANGLRAFRQLPNSEFLVARDASGRALGYGLIGKAQDLPHTLHEIVGDKKVVAPLLTHLIESGKSDLKTMLRVHYPAQAPLSEELHYWLGNKEPEAFALVKLANARGFADYLTQNRILGNVKIEFLEEGFRLVNASGREEFFSPDVSHLTQLFLSPFHPREFGTLSPALTAALKDFHPLNPYLWGLDSV